VFVTAVGVGHNRAIWLNDGRTAAPELALRLLPYSLAVGVCNNPDTVASVGIANGTRWYTFPASIIPERGKVSENVSSSDTKEAWHVFNDDEAGS
jgi:hypothetical protein